MKRMFLLLSALFTANTAANAQNPQASGKILVAYYSASGNTRAVAEQIAALTGGDLFVIEPQKAYPTDYKTLTEVAKKEIAENYKPALKGKAADMSQYDTIIVGSPCWWSTIAPPVATFLASYDLNGKTVAPFMTHEGSRMGHSEADIKKLCPKSGVTEGLPIRGTQAKNSKDEISAWLKKIKIVK